MAAAIEECLISDDPIRAVQLASLHDNPVLLARACLSLGAVGRALDSYGRALECSNHPAAADELEQLLVLRRDWLDHPARIRQLFAPPVQSPARAHAGTVVTFESRASARIACSVFAPPTPTSPRGIALYFHGNAEDATDCERISDRFHRLGLVLVVVEPRGYGRSSHVAPALTALLDDLEPLVRDDDVLRRVRAAAGPAATYLPVLVFGRSIGCHCAIHVCALAAALGDVTWASGLVLDSGCASVRHWESIVENDDGGASSGRPPVPGGLQTVGVLENRGKLRGLSAYAKLRLLVLHGSVDRLVPPFQAQLLRDCFPRSLGGRPLAKLVVLDGCGHNDLDRAPQYDAAVSAFVGEALGRETREACEV